MKYVVTVFTNATNVNKEKFPPVVLQMSEYDDMECLRRKAWKKCHAGETSYTEDDMGKAMMNIVINKQKIGTFKADENEMRIKDWVMEKGIDGFEFTLYMNMAAKWQGGGKRGRITGEVMLTPPVAAKIASLPQILTTLEAVSFDVNDLKTFFRNLTDQQLDDMVAMWEHGKLNHKHKITQMLMAEPNMKAIDDITELANAFRDKFHAKFEKEFTVDIIKQELAYEYRRRSELPVP